MSLCRYGSKIQKVSRYRPTVSNETIPATNQEFFFTKLAPLQSRIDIALFDFLINTAPLHVISFYNIIYFFVKKFFLNVSISVNTIFECSYLFFG